jgi:peptidoglycan-associated lipoprotein
MKITTLALSLLAMAACSHDKPKAATTTPVAKDDVPPPAKQDKPPAQVTTDQQVSPGIALSGDIAELCEIKPSSPDANPKFDYDKDELTTADRAVLDKLAACLTTGKLKGKAVSLIGRADPRGTEEYNLGLGSRRAETVSTYLARLGVGKPQLAVTTRGALDATGTDEAGWQKDRRVDITLAANG